ncbi:MAG: hypothetical protein LH654_01710 [Thermoleophilia bacterium]|nr:hypothetical protein [Thermoleophilia bacterium]
MIARIRPKLVLLVVAALALVGFSAPSELGTVAVAPPAAAAIAAACAGTLPNRAVHPVAGFGPGGFNYGNARLRVQLNWPRGVLRAGVLADGGARATINRDGSISAKVGWWVRDVARLSIVGRRLDGPAPSLRVRIPFGYGPQSDIGASLGFQPTALIFPTAGCWRVVGKAGTARLTLVVRVAKLQ